MEYIIITLLAIAATTVVIYTLANKVFGVSLRLKSLVLCAACALFISIVLPRIVVSFTGLAGTVGFLAVFAVVFAYFVAYYDDPAEAKASANAVSAEDVLPPAPALTSDMALNALPSAAPAAVTPIADSQPVLTDAPPELSLAEDEAAAAEVESEPEEPELTQAVPIGLLAPATLEEPEAELAGTLINMVFETAPADEPAVTVEPEEPPAAAADCSAAPAAVFAAEPIHIDVDSLCEIDPAIFDITAGDTAEPLDEPADTVDTIDAAAPISDNDSEPVEPVETEPLPLYNNDIPLVPYYADESRDDTDVVTENPDNIAETATEQEAPAETMDHSQPTDAVADNDSAAEYSVAEVEALPATEEEEEEEEEAMILTPQVMPEPASDSLDDLLDFAFTQKELANHALALDAFRLALRLYRDTDAAPFLIIEIANLLKNKGAYDEAVMLLTDGRTLPALQQDFSLDQEFINTIAYLRIVKNILLHNRLGFMPFNKIPAEITKEIDAEFRDWRSLA